MTESVERIIGELRANVTEILKILNDIQRNLKEASSLSIENKHDIEVNTKDIQELKVWKKEKSSWWSGVFGRLMSTLIVGIIMFLVGALGTNAIDKARLQESPVQKARMKNLQLQIEKQQIEIKRLERYK